MQDRLYLQSRLHELEHSLVAQSIDETLAHQAKLDTLNWAFANGTPKTEIEIKNRLNNCQEELHALHLMQDRSYRVKVVEAKIRELTNILN